ncbi:MAG: hypothetical protein ACYSTN_05585 [Planctomycetota bacterium]
MGSLSGVDTAKGATTIGKVAWSSRCPNKSISLQFILAVKGWAVSFIATTAIERKLSETCGLDVSHSGMAAMMRLAKKRFA